jgi:hypothetical protein
MWNAWYREDWEICEKRIEFLINKSSFSNYLLKMEYLLLEYKT